MVNRDRILSLFRSNKQYVNKPIEKNFNNCLSSQLIGSVKSTFFTIVLLCKPISKDEATARTQGEAISALYKPAMSKDILHQ